MIDSGKFTLPFLTGSSHQLAPPPGEEVKAISLRSTILPHARLNVTTKNKIISARIIEFEEDTDGPPWVSFRGKNTPNKSSQNLRVSLTKCE
jgi:hypothetical protein